MEWLNRPRSSWAGSDLIRSRRKLPKKAIVGEKLSEKTKTEAAAAACPTAKSLDNTDFVMSWRTEMTRHYVSGTLRELGGLPVSEPRDGVN